MVFQLDYTQNISHKLNDLKIQQQGLDRHQLMIKFISYLVTLKTSKGVRERRLHFSFCSSCIVSFFFPNRDDSIKNEYRLFDKQAKTI